ncbi:MAG: type II secretion system protein [Clostridia bacterium]|nr:type II secretion system protein [Clostridia bacterium]
MKKVIKVLLATTLISRVLKMNNEKGFTLLEIMISLLILGIALVPMYNAFSSQTITVKYNANKTEAIGLAQEIMENLKAKNLNKEILMSDDRKLIQGHTDFEYEINIIDELVESIGGTQINRLLKVKVTVYYNISEQERHVELVTKMGDWQ